MGFKRLLPENETEFIEEMKKEGIINTRWLSEERGYIGLSEYVFTIGVVFGIDRTGYAGRWCFPKEIYQEAIVSFFEWDGLDDPKGDWVKYKGKNGEYSNPNIKEIY